MGGTLIYKCRNCGAIDRSIHVPQGQLAMYLLRTQGGYGAGSAVDVRLYEIHTCDKNIIGMMEFIGVELDGYERLE